MKACVRLDPVLFETSIVSVSRALAFGSLARQPQLPAPAKPVEMIHAQVFEDAVEPGKKTPR